MFEISGKVRYQHLHDTNQEYIRELEDKLDDMEETLSTQCRRHVSVIQFRKIRGRKNPVPTFATTQYNAPVHADRRTRFPNNHRHLQIHNTEDGDENVEVFTKTRGRVFSTAEGIMTGKIGHFLQINYNYYIYKYSNSCRSY